MTSDARARAIADQRVVLRTAMDILGQAQRLAPLIDRPVARQTVLKVVELMTSVAASATLTIADLEGEP